MSGKIRISVDAMGGDKGPEIVVRGAALLADSIHDIHFYFHGQEGVLAPLIGRHAVLAGRTSLKHCEQVIGMDEKPSQAVRKGRNSSSMWSALQSLKDGEADVAVSGGNTGALMAMATVCLRQMAGIARPAIAAIWPTMRTEIIVLDVGATVGGDAQQLVDFSILGAALARARFGHVRPTVGLLNVGVEELKGLEPVREAGRVLASAQGNSFHYHGFVEGDDIGKGTVDVVVTDGFTGNIALKTAEGTARQLSAYIREAFTANFASRMGAFLASSALNRLRQRMDPRTVNGGVFLGLNGVVIKSHGGTDEVGFRAALNLAYDMARGRLIDKIGEGLQQFHPTIPNGEPELREQGRDG